MKKLKMLGLLTLIALAAAALPSCSNNKAEQTQTETQPYTMPVTEPEPDHILLRRFTINEVFADLHADSVDFTFPIILYEFEETGKLSDCKYEKGTPAYDGYGTILEYGKMIFPGGRYCEVMFPIDEKNHEPPEILNYLHAEKGVAPNDFTAYGIKFGMSYKDVKNEYGIPDYIFGHPDSKTGSCIFTGAGLQQFEVEFKNGYVYSMTFRQ